MVSELYFFLPIQITFVLSKLTFKPETAEKSDKVSKVSFKDLLDPSKMKVVSSAYWESLCSVLFIFIPVTFSFDRIFIDSISAQRIKM